MSTPATRACRTMRPSTGRPIPTGWSLSGDAQARLLRHLPQDEPEAHGAYVSEFAGRNNLSELDTIDQMSTVVLGMEGKRLRYQDLVGLLPWCLTVRQNYSPHSLSQGKQVLFEATLNPRIWRMCRRRFFSQVVNRSKHLLCVFRVLSGHRYQQHLDYT